ncbi:MAG: hypothetical protein MI741_06280 [Rhodospirillales bacterium]|nr:hypothetical protein [Rhodospirillales bacterium]
METIHFKTVDPIGQAFLRSAAKRGIDLNWERFETQQPQDGFLRLGLSCPFGCLQGPCRIDPFGRGAQEGVCGLGRDQMVAATLLRIVLHGAVASGIGTGADADPMITGLAGELGEDISATEISEAAAMLCQPSAPPSKLIRQALRLGVFTLAVGSESVAGNADYRIGYGLLAGGSPVAGVCGEIPGDGLLAIDAACAEAGIKLAALGPWAEAGTSILPSVCTSSEAEAVVASGRIGAIVIGSSAPSGLRRVAEKSGVALFDGTAEPSPSEIVESARKTGAAAADGIDIEPTIMATAKALRSSRDFASDGNGAAGKRALLGGQDSLFQSSGWVATEVGKALASDGFKVSGWGDAAAWMVKAGLGEMKDNPVRVLDPKNAVYAALKAGPEKLSGVCFIGLGSVRDLSLALGLAACGVPVCLATPVPVWGSQTVMTELESQLAADKGSITHFDHPAGADEVLAWFREL